MILTMNEIKRKRVEEDFYGLIYENILKVLVRKCFKIEVVTLLVKYYNGVTTIIILYADDMSLNENDGKSVDGL